MSNHLYRCISRDTRMLCRGVKISYDGDGCLTIQCGRYITAISAEPGETVVITVDGRTATIK